MNSRQGWTLPANPVPRTLGSNYAALRSQVFVQMPPPNHPGHDLLHATFAYIVTEGILAEADYRSGERGGSPSLIPQSYTKEIGGRITARRNMCLLAPL